MRRAIDLAAIVAALSVSMLVATCGFALGVTTSDAAPTCTTQTGDFIFADVDGRDRP